MTAPRQHRTGPAPAEPVRIQGYRARAYRPHECIDCHQTFTPRSGNAKRCDQCGDPRHRSNLPPHPVAERKAKPPNGNFAPDFLRAFPEMRREFERVAGHRYDRNAPIKRGHADD